jgi:hypothetical protein
VCSPSLLFGLVCLVAVAGAIGGGAYAASQVFLNHDNENEIFEAMIIIKPINSLE